jgi:hypothetical protein
MALIGALIAAWIVAYLLSFVLPTFLVVIAFPFLVYSIRKAILEAIEAERTGSAGHIIQNPEAFSLTPYAVPMQPPTQEMRKAKALHTYAKELKAYADSLAPKVEGAALVLQKNAAYLGTRQRQLKELGGAAVVMIERFLPKLRQRNIEPAPVPNYLPSLRYEHSKAASPRALGASLSAAGQTVSHSLTRILQGHTGSGDLVVAGIAVAAAIVLHKSAVSKAIRELTNAHGEVVVYANEMRDTVELLRRGNDEVISIIHAIEEVGRTTAELMTRYGEMAITEENLDHLSETQRNLVIELFRYVLMIEQQIQTTA